MNTVSLCRPMTISHGAASSVVAMTEPRPRLTNTIGSVQQTSAAKDDERPSTETIRSRTSPPFPSSTGTPRPRHAKAKNQISSAKVCRWGGSCRRAAVRDATGRRDTEAGALAGCTTATAVADGNACVPRSIVPVVEAPTVCPMCLQQSWGDRKPAHL
jgi:hypothetical protein